MQLQDTEEIEKGIKFINTYLPEELANPLVKLWISYIQSQDLTSVNSNLLLNTTYLILDSLKKEEALHYITELTNLGINIFEIAYYDRCTIHDTILKHSVEEYYTLRTHSAIYSTLQETRTWNELYDYDVDNANLLTFVLRFILKTGTLGYFSKEYKNLDSCYRLDLTVYEYLGFKAEDSLKTNNYHTTASMTKTLDWLINGYTTYEISEYCLNLVPIDYKAIIDKAKSSNQPIKELSYYLNKPYNAKAVKIAVDYNLDVEPVVFVVNHTDYDLTFLYKTLTKHKAFYDNLMVKNYKSSKFYLQNQLCLGFWHILYPDTPIYNEEIILTQYYMNKTLRLLSKLEVDHLTHIDSLLDFDYFNEESFEEYFPFIINLLARKVDLRPYFNLGLDDKELGEMLESLYEEHKDSPLAIPTESMTVQCNLLELYTH